MSLAAVRVQSVSVRTLRCDPRLVLLDKCLGLLQVLVLSAQERQTIVLFLPVVVGYLAVSAVNSGLRAFGQVFRYFFEFDLEAALASDGAIWAHGQVVECLGVG